MSSELRQNQLTEIYTTIQPPMHDIISMAIEQLCATPNFAIFCVGKIKSSNICLSIISKYGGSEVWDIGKIMELAFHTIISR
jgi:hypothetical protein